MDDSTEDQRKPHHRDPPQYLSYEKLAGRWVCRGRAEVPTMDALGT